MTENLSHLDNYKIFILAMATAQQPVHGH